MELLARRVFAVVAALSCATAYAGSPISGARDGAAIQGYDSVAYFTDQKAVRGTPQFSHEWSGAFWFFSSAANRDAFAAQPEKYAPQYGGHCALSVANGKSAKGSGEAWHVHNEKLYLNYDLAVQGRWKQKMESNIKWADIEWPKVRARLEAQ